MKSIRTKLIFYFVTLIIFASLMIGFIAIQNSSKAIVKEAENTLLQLAIDGAKLTESGLETEMKTLTMIAQRLDIQEMNWQVQRQILSRQVEKTNFLDIGVADLLVMFISQMEQLSN